jgi:hypothetical protein
VTTLKRLAALPNVPTLDERGLKGFEVKVWCGMYAPKGTLAPVLRCLMPQNGFFREFSFDWRLSANVKKPTV